jgi:Na+-translocating ferredoxin:NAD+ oxidoreductase subunit G
MAKYIKMILVLSIIALTSGLVLGGLNEITYETAQNNILKFKKIPAVTSIYESIKGTIPQENRIKVESELLTERKEVNVGEESPLLVFVIKKDDKPYAVAFEKFGGGFGGDLGVMVGYKLDSGDIAAIGITTMSETPGLGTLVKEKSFLSQFTGLSKDTKIMIKKDDGDIDAVTGATVSSRAVTQAIRRTKALYDKHQGTIKTEINQ